MANEISLTESLTCYKPSIMSSAIGRSVTGLQFTMTGNFFTEGSMSVATSATAIPLGQVVSPHWAWFNNLDPTNYVTIRNGSGGADLCQLFPGESAWVPLFSTCVPFAVAHTAAVQLEYLILSL